MGAFSHFCITIFSTHIKQHTMIGTGRKIFEMCKMQNKEDLISRHRASCLMIQSAQDLFPIPLWQLPFKSLKSLRKKEARERLLPECGARATRHPSVVPLSDLVECFPVVSPTFAMSPTDDAPGVDPASVQLHPQPAAGEDQRSVGRVRTSNNSCFCEKEG